MTDGAEPRARADGSDRGPADHPRLRAAARRSSCSTAPQVFLQPFIYTTFLSTLPPLILLAVGLTFVIGAGEIDLSFPASSPSRASSSPSCSRNTTSAGSPWSPASPRALLVGFVNGILVAKIGIPSFIATLGTQFFWAGMATVLSGGKSYALRGAEESSVWQWIVGRPFAGSETRLDRAAADPGALDGDRSSSSSGSSSTATASASTCCSSAIPTPSRASSASTSSARRSSSSP